MAKIIMKPGNKYELITGTKIYYKERSKGLKENYFFEIGTAKPFTVSDGALNTFHVKRQIP